MKRTISSEDLLKIYSSNRIPDKFKIIFWIGDNDGLRVCEILRLKIDDLEFHNNLYRLRVQKNGLINRSRYMSERTKERLIPYIINYWNKIKEANGFIIFSRYKGRALTRQGFFVQFWKYRKWLGLDTDIIGHDALGRTLYAKTYHATRRKSTCDYRKALIKNHIANPTEYLKIHGGWTSDAYERYLVDDDETVRLNGRLKEKLMADR